MGEKLKQYKIIGREHINIQSNFQDHPWKRHKWRFQNDTITAFGGSIPLITTTSRHHVIPLPQAKQVANNIDRESSTRVTLIITENELNKAMALKR